MVTGVSRPHFFKVYPSVFRESTVLAARGLASKLQHVSVVADIAGPYRSLLVTQAVGPDERRPISLRQWLGRPSLSTEAIRSVAAQVESQLCQMGGASPNVQTLDRFLWPYHDEERLRKEWQNWGQIIESAEGDPLAVMQELLASTREIRFTEHSFIHGDLHADNIAIYIGDSENDPYAFVFDAGATARAPRLKDIAMLEVSVLLHSGEGLTPEVLDELFASQDAGVGSSQVSTFVRALRSRCSPEDDSEWLVYAVLVFDQALVQLGGLAFGISGNNVRNPRDAALLAATSARWLNKLLCGKRLN